MQDETSLEGVASLPTAVSGVKNGMVMGMDCSSGPSWWTTSCDRFAPVAFGPCDIVSGPLREPFGGPSGDHAHHFPSRSARRRLRRSRLAERSRMTISRNALIAARLPFCVPFPAPTDRPVKERYIVIEIPVRINPDSFANEHLFEQPLHDFDDMWFYPRGTSETFFPNDSFSDPAVLSDLIDLPGLACVSKEALLQLPSSAYPACEHLVAGTPTPAPALRTDPAAITEPTPLVVNDLAQPEVSEVLLPGPSLGAEICYTCLASLSEACCDFHGMSISLRIEPSVGTSSGSAASSSTDPVACDQDSNEEASDACFPCDSEEEEWMDECNSGECEVDLGVWKFHRDAQRNPGG